jgi:ribonucleoside-diphosphate reductase alpha chain
VIDKTFYPVDKARRSNLLHRPIGIGVQGLADTFVKMRFPFDSESARDLNRKIFETIYHGAMEESIAIAEERTKNENCLFNEFEIELKNQECKFPGAYATFEGSPLSKGIFQHDMWDNVILSGMYNWELLRKKVMKYGARNSLLVAPMPTASTSQIMGFNEAFEPFTANLYKRKTLAGEFIVTNKYLIQDLISKNLWNKTMKEKLMLMEGSIQNIPEIPDEIKMLYKTVWDISQRCVIDMAADRGAFICQSQSMNIFLADPKVRQITSMHFYAWKKGLKTGMYYLRIKPKVNAQQFTIVPKTKEQLLKEDKEEHSECLNCSA